VGLEPTEQALDELEVPEVVDAEGRLEPVLGPGAVGELEAGVGHQRFEWGQSLGLDRRVQGRGEAPYGCEGAEVEL